MPHQEILYSSEVDEWNDEKQEFLLKVEKMSRSNQPTSSTSILKILFSTFYALILCTISKLSYMLGNRALS